MISPRGVAKDLPELLSFYGAGTGSHPDLGCGTRTLLIAPAGRFERVHEFAEPAGRNHLTNPVRDPVTEPLGSCGIGPGMDRSLIRMKNMGDPRGGRDRADQRARRKGSGFSRARRP